MLKTSAKLWVKLCTATSTLFFSECQFTAEFLITLDFDINVNKM
jgi:hypothetical protein